MGGHAMKIVLMALFTLAACSDEKKEKDREVNDFYSEMLKIDQQKKCNSEGKFFDALKTENGCNNQVALARWPCTRDGLEKQMAARDKNNGGASFYDKAQLASLDVEIKNGFEMYECGEDSLRVFYVYLIKRGRNSDSASLEMKVAAFSVPTTPPSVQEPSSAASPSSNPNSVAGSDST